MKKILIARHGYYLANGELSLLGAAQMRGVRDFVVSNYRGLRCVVVASPSVRTEMGAETIAEGARCLYVTEEALFSGFKGKEYVSTDVSKVMSIIKENSECDVLIFVTHLEYAEELPSEIGEEILGVKGFPFEEIQKGDFWVVDLESKSITLEKARCS